jgi:hypothetical protein
MVPLLNECFEPIGYDYPIDHFGRDAMSPVELRQKLHDQLDQIPEVELPKLQQYLAELTLSPAVPTVATGASLLVALKSMGTWQGDDLQDCLQAVYDSRSPAKFRDDENNPFN